MPTLTQLESFTEQSLRQWRNAANNLRTLQSALFFGLELERQIRSQALVDSIRTNLGPGQPFERWARIVDYRYSLAPLSVAGSLKTEGGRFNIGGGLNAANFPSFPALYIAESYETAFVERFGSEPASERRGLAADELALRSPASFTHVALRGELELVLDIRQASCLQDMAKVLRQFSMPPNLRRLARSLGMRSPPSLVRSAPALQRQLMHRDWRAMPMHFDLPANSQIFGRLAVAAGAHAILYASTRRTGESCLALFPQNWCGSRSFVEVMEGAPSSARLVRLDGVTRNFM